MKNLNKQKTDYTATINLLYKNLFNRDPNNEGLDFWNDKLNLDYSYGDML